MKTQEMWRRFAGTGKSTARFPAAGQWTQFHPGASAHPDSGWRGEQAAIGAAPDTRRPRRLFPWNHRLEVLLALAMAAMLFSSRAQAQQFNSDNYWTAPEGTMTVVATVGQQYSTLVDVVTLFPGWEFNIGATLYKEDILTDTTNHYSTTAYVKHMFYENEAKTGGWAVMAGTVSTPAISSAGR